MPRTLTTIVLMLATLIGPCLCCCAWASLVQPTPEPISTVAQSTPLGDDEFVCPHCRPPVAPKPTEPVPLMPSPTERHCPCCDDRATTAMVAEVVPTIDVVQLAVLDLLPVLSETTGNKALPGEIIIQPRGLQQTPFLIDYCHRLRC